MKKIIECVPNFSEGNDAGIIEKICDSIKAVPGVKLLNVDPGKATNRTVITFVGDEESIICKIPSVDMIQWINQRSLSFMRDMLGNQKFNAEINIVMSGLPEHL